MAIPGRRTPRALGPLARRIALSTLLGTALATAVAPPALADPTRIPDPGARPAPSGDLRLPDGRAADAPAPIVNPELGPLAAEVAALEMAIATAAEQLKALELEWEPARETVVAAELAWLEADAALVAAQEAADELIGDTYRSAASLPSDLYGPALRNFSVNGPVPVDSPLGVESAIRDLITAEETEQLTADALEVAIADEEALAEEHATRAELLADLETELAGLRERNTDQLVEVEQQREQADERAAPDHLADGEAHPDAVAAVQFALAQRGKPYLWGAQGPDRYDCSGLMWDAYRSVGIELPRVANDQYWGTRSRPVARHQLLPGDLIFFSSDPTNWRAIGHVGMYIGDGKMVHAPRSGDVVRVQAVWWSNFFGATRVVGAVPPGSGGTVSPPAADPPRVNPPRPPSSTPTTAPARPAPTPSRTAIPTPSKSPTTTPPTSRPPTSTPPTSASPSTPPTSAPPSSATPSSGPTGSSSNPSPSAPGSTSPSGSSSPSGSTSPSGSSSPSGSAGPTGGASPSGSSSPSGTGSASPSGSATPT